MLIEYRKNFSDRQGKSEKFFCAIFCNTGSLSARVLDYSYVRDMLNAWINLNVIV